MLIPINLRTLLSMRYNNASHAANSSNMVHVLKRITRHANYVGEPTLVERCFRPYNYVEDIREACEFVETREACSGTVVYFNYLKFMVCYLNLENNAIGLVLTIISSLIAALIFMTWGYVVTRYFFYPNTVVLHNKLGLKEYPMGAVITALIRELPRAIIDFGICMTFSRAYSLNHADSLARITIDFLMGLAVVCLMIPVHIEGGVFLRDILFVTCAVAFLHINLEREMYNMVLPPLERTDSSIVFSSYLCIVIYLVYLMIEMAYARLKDAPERAASDSIPTSSESYESDDYPYKDDNPTETQIDPCHVFYMNMNPFVNIESNHKWVKVILAPFFIISAIMIPVVRPDRELHGWSQFLFPFSMIPLIAFVMSFEISLYTAVGTYVVALISVFFVYFLTNSQRIPKHHDFVSIWGMLLCTMVIALIENELNVFSWQMLNYLFNWNDDAIVIFWWSFSSLGLECIYVFVLVRKGYRQLALGAVIGSVIFTAFMSLPSMSLSVCFVMDQFFLVTPGTETAFVFSYVALFVVLFSGGLSGFVFRWSHAVFFMGIIFIFSIFILLSNDLLVHPYGTIHAVQLFPNSIHAGWA